MRRIAVVVVAVVVGVAGGFATRALPASGSTPARVTPGDLDFGSPSFIEVDIFNPTDRAIRVTEHLVSPLGSFPSTADSHVVVKAHTLTHASPWSCSSSSCFGEPIFTLSSGKAIVSMYYNDPDANHFVTLYAGDFKRF
jgi:hypothetical protein